MVFNQLCIYCEIEVSSCEKKNAEVGLQHFCWQFFNTYIFYILLSCLYNMIKFEIKTKDSMRVFYYLSIWQYCIVTKYQIE